LLPVFALFFSIDLAIAMTAIVHLLNNFFKLTLLGKYADKIGTDFTTLSKALKDDGIQTFF